MLSNWKNLKRWQKWVIVLVCLAVLGKVFEITGIAPKTETEPVKTVQTASSSSKAKPKASKPSSSAKASSSKSEEQPSKESSSEPSSSEDKLKDITEGQMGSFIDYFKQDLTDKGLDISTYSFYKLTCRILLMECLPKNMKRSTSGLQSTMSTMSVIQCFTLRRMTAMH